MGSDGIGNGDLLLVLAMSLWYVYGSTQKLALIIFISELDDSHDDRTEILQSLLGQRLIPPCAPSSF